VLYTLTDYDNETLFAEYCVYCVGISILVSVSDSAVARLASAMTLAIYTQCVEAGPTAVRWVSLSV
jgi:hypothetical protein